MTPDGRGRGRGQRNKSHLFTCLLVYLFLKASFRETGLAGPAFSPWPTSIREGTEWPQDCTALKCLRAPVAHPTQGSETILTDRTKFQASQLDLPPPGSGGGGGGGPLSSFLPEESPDGSWGDG